jgi:iron-regulated transporter 1
VLISTTHGFIVLQRLVVAASCVIFYILAIGIPMSRAVNIVLLATLTLLACVEKLCSVLNMVSVEKDWVSLYTILTLIAY